MKMKKTLMSFIMVVVLLAPLAFSSAGLASEAVRICRPCSRAFIPEMEKVIAELKLEDQVSISKTGCLGACGDPYVLEFRSEIYTGMDGDGFRALLKEAFGI